MKPTKKQPKKNPADERIWFSRRGEVHLPLGGHDRCLRFRTKQIDLLERRRGRSILAMVADENSVGVGFLRDAIIVGVAHEFAGKRNGKKVEALTEDMVNGWIDDIEDGGSGLTFDDVVRAVMKAIVGGLPGGQRIIDAMDDDEEEGDDDEDGNPTPAPAPAS